MRQFRIAYHFVCFAPDAGTRPPKDQDPRSPLPHPLVGETLAVPPIAGTVAWEATAAQETQAVEQEQAVERERAALAISNKKRDMSEVSPVLDEVVGFVEKLVQSALDAVVRPVEKRTDELALVEGERARAMVAFVLASLLEASAGTRDHSPLGYQQTHDWLWRTPRSQPLARIPPHSRVHHHQR